MDQPTTSSPIASVSPTRLERLLACPLRIAFEQTTTGRGRRRETGWTLVGQAAHRAIELVLRDAVSVDEAWDRACNELAATSGEPRDAHNARRALLRLERRLPDLLTYIEAQAPAETLSEHELTSPDGTVGGTLDVLLLGDKPRVIDHKTGVVLEDGLPKDRYERQLAIYAWLVEVALSVEVPIAVLFSLREGLVEVDTSAAIRRTHGDQAQEARRQFNERAPGPQPATPSAEACGTCPFVGSCEPAWDALASGAVEHFGWGDAARGVVRAPVVLTTGRFTAIPIEVEVGTAFGSGMIIDVPEHLARNVVEGQRIAAWRLGRRSDDPLVFSWREGSSGMEFDSAG